MGLSILIRQLDRFYGEEVRESEAPEHKAELAAWLPAIFLILKETYASTQMPPYSAWDKYVVSQAELAAEIVEGAAYLMSVGKHLSIMHNLEPQALDSVDFTAQGLMDELARKARLLESDLGRREQAQLLRSFCALALAFAGAALVEDLKGPDITTTLRRYGYLD